MKTYMQLVEQMAENVQEVFPWDVEEDIPGKRFKLIIDIRESYEFTAMRIKDSINIPRGVIESACEWNYEETQPQLVNARDKNILIICRSGHRSILACHTMQLLGYENVYSLKTGLRGWFEYEMPLVNANNKIVDEDTAEDFFTSQVRTEQLSPNQKNLKS